MNNNYWGLMKQLNRLRKFLLSDKAITAIEFALLAAGIALVVVVGAKFLGGKVSNNLSYIGTQV